MTDDKAAQEVLANLIGSLAANLVGGAVGGESGASASANADKYNRQLHPSEVDWIVANAKKFADEQCSSGNCISEKEATQILLRQALMLVDSKAEKTFRELTGNVNYNIPYIYSQEALNFLKDASGILQNASGQWQDFFTAPGGQRDDPLYFINFYDPVKNPDAAKYRDIMLSYAAPTEKEIAARPSYATMNELRAFVKSREGLRIDPGMDLSFLKGRDMIIEQELGVALANLAEYLYDQGLIESHRQVIDFIDRGDLATIMEDKWDAFNESYSGDTAIYYDYLRKGLVIKTIITISLFPI